MVNEGASRHLALVGLVARVNQVLDAQVRAVAESLGITTSQAVALRELSEPVTLTDLAARMCCEASNAGYVVDRMQEQGLVERSPHPTDRRAKIIGLTTAGRRCRQNVLRALQKQPPLQVLDQQQQQLLAELLGRVATAAE